MKRKFVQMVPMKDGSKLFLLEYDEDKGELTYRSTNNPAYKQKQLILIKGDTVYAGIDQFPIVFLNNLIEHQK